MADLEHAKPLDVWDPHCGFGAQEHCIFIIALHRSGPSSHTYGQFCRDSRHCYRVLVGVKEEACRKHTNWQHAKAARKTRRQASTLEKPTIARGHPDKARRKQIAIFGKDKISSNNPNMHVVILMKQESLFCSMLKPFCQIATFKDSKGFPFLRISIEFCRFLLITQDSSGFLWFLMVSKGFFRIPLDINF